MAKHCEILEYFSDLTNLMLNLLDSLLSFFNDGLIENNFIIQKNELLSAGESLENHGQATEEGYIWIARLVPEKNS